MSEEKTKTYILTVGYREGPTGSEVTDAPGHPNDGKTHTEALLDRFLSYIREHVMKPDPASFSARVISCIEQE